MDVIIRKGMRPYPLKAKAADPSPEEIAARAAEIRAEWSPQERWSRMRADWRATFRRADGEHVEFDAETYEEHVDGQRSFESPDDDWRDPAD